MTGQYPEPIIGCTGNPLPTILHSCSCNRIAASSNTSTDGLPSNGGGDQRISAAALARGQRRGITLIELIKNYQELHVILLFLVTVGVEV